MGSYVRVPPEGNLLAYERRYAGERLLIVLNLSHEHAEMALRAGTAENPRRGRLLVSTCLDRIDEAVSGNLALRGDEGVILDFEG
jgi:alpha-glucosidase